MIAAITQVWRLPMPTLRHAPSHRQSDAGLFRDSLRFVFRRFPLTEVHPLAGIAAESAEFAGAASLFWEMHDELFENQSILSISG
jgi:hypothetical protein